LGGFKEEGMGFEVIESREPAFGGPGVSMETTETTLGVYESERDAVEAGRQAWRAFRADPSRDVVWWTVRRSGEQLARWIADGHNDVERVLDLTTNELVVVRV
jgi:hypothetical protein